MVCLLAGYMVGLRGTLAGSPPEWGPPTSLLCVRPAQPSAMLPFWPCPGSCHASCPEGEDSRLTLQMEGRWIEQVQPLILESSQKSDTNSNSSSYLRCRSCRRRGFNPWVREIPWRRKWQPTPVFSPGESHGQRMSKNVLYPHNGLLFDCKKERNSDTGYNVWTVRTLY